jgi:hypothetical protein
LIARVYAGDDDRFHVAAEIVGAKDAGAGGGQSLTTVPVGVGLVVGCRCKRLHDLDAAALNTEAMQARAGRPRRTPVTKVEKSASTS